MPLHATPTRGGRATQATPRARPPDSPPPSLHIRNQLAPPGEGAGEAVSVLVLPLHQGPRQSCAWISCLPSGQFLLIKEQEPRLVSRSHPHLPRARGSFHWACVSLFFQADSLRAFRDCDGFHQHLSFCRIRLGLEETLNPLAPSEIKHKEDF